MSSRQDWSCSSQYKHKVTQTLISGNIQKLQTYLWVNNYFSVLSSQHLQSRKLFQGERIWGVKHMQAKRFIVRLLLHRDPQNIDELPLLHKAFYTHVTHSTQIWALQTIALYEMAPSVFIRVAIIIHTNPAKLGRKYIVPSTSCDKWTSISFMWWNDRSKIMSPCW